MESRIEPYLRFAASGAPSPESNTSHKIGYKSDVFRNKQLRKRRKSKKMKEQCKNKN
jgi:hypothetical protein